MRFSRVRWTASFDDAAASVSRCRARPTPPLSPPNRADDFLTSSGDLTFSFFFFPTYFPVASTPFNNPILFFCTVRMLREEIQLLQEPGSYVGEVIKVMGKTKVLVKVRRESQLPARAPPSRPSKTPAPSRLKPPASAHLPETPAPTRHPCVTSPRRRKKKSAHEFMIFVLDTFDSDECASRKKMT